jgi:predicted membrane-bound spermidine synthase
LSQARPALRFRERLVAGGVSVAFFLSGLAALVYQVAWERILALHSGVGIYSIAMIVAAFLAGLGAGSHLGGVLSLRVQTPAAALRTFAALELAIGAFGALSCRIFYDWLYPLAPTLYGAPWRAALAHFLALVLPTVLMGMSLPFLVRGLVHDGRTAGSTIGVLYGVNVLGASVGALLTPWVLVRFFGLRGAVLVAAGANVLAALFVLAIAGLVVGSRREAASSDVATEPPAAVLTPASEAVPFRLWLLVYGLSGFCALSLEIVWFRVVDVAVKSTAFTFGTVLFLYLLGSGAGCLIGARLAPRVARPLSAFLLCQCALLAYAAAALLAFATLPADLPLYRWFVGYWRDGNPLLPGRPGTLGGLLLLYLGLPLVLYGPPTLLMGLSFPILQRAVQDDPRTSGFKVGLLQACNIAGCVAGTLLVGLAALSRLGTVGTLRALLACGIVFASIGLWRAPRRAFGVAAVVLLALLVALPAGDAFWRRLHGQQAGDRALVEEDASSVVALTSRHPGRWRVWVNGHSHSYLPFGGVHSLLGALPVVVHPSPRQVAVVGLGSGNTAWAGGCRSETERVTVFEISAPQPRLLQRLAAMGESPASLDRLLQDPRVALRVADGRNALLKEDARYDVIEIDALWAFYAGSGNLYSVEFFDLASRRLQPGGLMCTWAPTHRVRDTFRRVFPYVLATREILLGSREPLGHERFKWRERLARPDVAAYLGEETASDLARVLQALRRLEAPPEDARLNHDLLPRDEFALGGR